MAFSVVRFGVDDAAMADARAIRTEVFCGEQGVPQALEWDGLDPACDHFLLSDGAAPIAAARLRPYAQGVAKVERVAVLVADRGRGAGRAIMAAILDRAREQGVTRIVLNAQAAVETFYRDLGFRPEGPHFMEAGIDHVAMTLSL